MLNRRILRIKVFKELFAIKMRPDGTLAAAEKEFDAAAESTRELYLFLLASIPAITDAASARIQQLAMKINKTEQEKNPNMKFVENPLAALLREDPDFQKVITKKKMSWGPYDLILQKIFASIQTKAYFDSYMSSRDNSLKAACKLFSRIFEDEFVGREDLETALEEGSIYWNDDLAYSLTCCCKTLSSLASGSDWSLPELYLSSTNPDMEDDRAFAHKLLREAYNNYDEFYSEVSSCVPGWDRDRLVGTDMAIIVTALAEMKFFPDIPIRVSINEYVEISKYFGTPKSSIFVNGILDAMSKKPDFQKHK